MGILEEAEKIAKRRWKKMSKRRLGFRTKSLEELEEKDLSEQIAILAARVDDHEKRLKKLEKQFKELNDKVDKQFKELSDKVDNLPSQVEKMLLREQDLITAVVNAVAHAFFSNY